MPIARRVSAPSRRHAAALWALLLLGLFLALPAWCGVRDAPGKDLEVSLITYGPGTIYWERFGHDAIQIRDTVSGESVNFNYGVFDFKQKDFLLNFARGRMNYMMDAEPSQAEMDWYKEQGRSVRRQVLSLSPEQAATLRDNLFVNLRPENLHYHYDYFVNNCTTKVRDALDQVLGGQLQQQLSGQQSNFSYRQQTDRLMAGQPWLMLALDLGLSSYADQPINAWQGAFLPDTLAEGVANAEIGDGATHSRPLVAGDTLLATSQLTPPPVSPPDLRVPLGLAGLGLAVLLLLLGRMHSDLAHLGFGIVATAWLLLAGVAGLLMLGLWLLTAHQAAWANANLLLLNPLAFMLLIAVWRNAVSSLAHLVAWLVTLLAALALAANLSGFLSQQNLPWILLALPTWLAILHVLNHRARGA